MKNETNFELVQELIQNQKISFHSPLRDITNSNNKDLDIDKAIFDESFKYSDIVNLSSDVWPEDDSFSLNTDPICPFPGETVYDGNIVGEAAKEYYKIKNKCIDFDIYSKKMAIIKTIEQLNNKDYDVFFEPTFQYDKFITKCDVLIRDSSDSNAFHLVEVKASSNFKSKPVRAKDSFKNYLNRNKELIKIKKEHLYDLEYQYFVLKKLNINIKSVKMMFINNTYIKHGDINYEDFLMERSYNISKGENIPLIDICEQQLHQVELELNNLLALASLNKDPLELLINRKCLNQQYDKDCKHVSSFVDRHSVFELYRGMNKKTELFYNYDIKYLSKVDPEMAFKSVDKKGETQYKYFNNYQKRQINVTKNNADYVDRSKISYLEEVLSLYKKPLYMYDFETMKSSIPVFDGSFAYQQIPFQYSVHIITNDQFNYKNQENIEHGFFLGSGEDDPRLSLIKKLVQDLFSKGKGSYVAYNASFEKNILVQLYEYLDYLLDKSLISQLDAKFFQEKIVYIWQNTIDLMDFFKEFAIYLPNFNGSKSIKKTLPAFIPEFNYNDLKIQKGDMASEAFRRRVINDISEEDWNINFKADMIRYCNQDTLAMVAIFQEIKNMIFNIK